LIIINDGSTDNTGEIVENYKVRDSRIRIYHTENYGLSNARNLALSYARGEYITFVDSDDAVKEDYLECLYKNALEYNADVVVSSYYRYVEDEKTYYFVTLEKEYEVKIFQMSTMMNSCLMLLIATTIFEALSYIKQRKYTLGEEGITE
jgi:glycosyltransferase involved in cell wall biosynthesis